MNISLTAHLEKFIQKKVASGRYGSASEVIREALRLLEAQDILGSERLTDLRTKIAEGVADARRGAVVDGPTVVRRIQARVQRKAKVKKRGS